VADKPPQDAIDLSVLEGHGNPFNYDSCTVILKLAAFIFIAKWNIGVRFLRTLTLQSLDSLHVESRDLHGEMGSLERRSELRLKLMVGFE
jgi:hypothetical protein